MKRNRFNGSFYFLLFITSAASLLTVSIIIKIFPLFSAKTIYFCQQFFSKTLFQIPHTVSDTIIITLITALILSSLSFLIQVWKTNRLVRVLLYRRISLAKRIDNIAGSLGLTKKVYLIKDTNSYSFCTGVFFPKILITTSLVSSLTNKELEAVFLHEKAHLENYDPVKLLFGKTISWLFFFLPIFSEISKNMEATSEMLADWFVTNSQKKDKYLRNALKKIILTPQVNLAPVVAIANPDYLEIRIHKLINPTIKQSLSLSLTSIITSLIFFMFSIFLLQSPVSAFSVENYKKAPASYKCSSTNSCNQECGTSANNNTNLRYQISSYK